MIRRFVNWMETGPTLLTFWFIPLLIVIWLYARVKNHFTKGVTK